ncbi:hypothetical protein [Deinococcus enclensis]|uniref:Uncharacterized protein n=1 Tax=Deinococcus enclensis TaxID=1049582 RepID=A0ABT9M9M7_9DEIO|nr:hypothetical protein [Deinococcus enclensis]MDP9763272.1 hypothetical protein [Deinococcus enclensis]
MTNPQPNSGDVDQTEIIEDGMQGADGSTNADGLDPNADPRQVLSELKENLGDLAGEDQPE